MSRHKKGSPIVPEATVQGLLPAALARAGLALPTTPEQVAREESELEREPIAIPHRLRDPFAIFNPRPIRSEASSPQPPSVEVLEELRQAARFGGEISPDVRSRMEDDRAGAEVKKKSDGGESD